MSLKLTPGMSATAQNAAMRLAMDLPLGLAEWEALCAAAVVALHEMDQQTALKLTEGEATCQ